MIMKFLRLGAIALASFLGLATAASADPAPGRIMRYGRIFAVNVCGDSQLPGRARCFAKAVTDARGTILDGKPDLTSRTTPAGYGAPDLRSAYAITASGSATYTIAIVDAFGYPNAEADLKTYRAQFGLPPCTTSNGCFRKVNQTGGKTYPRTNVGWAQETALDLQMASAMCPNCHLLLVEATSDLLGNLSAAANYAASHANAVSNSYGGSEGGTATFERRYNHPGVAITVSSGDSGFGVQFPASSPHVTAVGGTSLLRASNARGWTETVWNGAGSGCSAVYPKPSWQHDALCARRAVADVSAVADPNTGVAVFGPTTARRSGWMVFGGTSVAAPLIAGIYGVHGGPATYGADPYANATALNDVTAGANGSCGGTYLCSGAAGYDGPSGLGTPIGPTAF